MLKCFKINAYFSYFNFRATFGGKIGVATTCAPNDLCLQTQPKS